MTENNIKLNPNKIHKLQTNVHSFLERYRINGNDAKEIKHTHVAMGDMFYGKFQLDLKAIKEFNKIYGEAIEYGVQLNIAEKPKDYGPILVDIDLEIPTDDHEKNTRLYNDNMIIAVIDAFRNGIKKYLDVDNETLQVCLLEKPHASDKGTSIKDGFHLIFNNICVYYKTRHLIRKEVVVLLENNDLFSHFTNSMDHIVDKAVVSGNNWLMFGSKKKDGQLYKLTKIINYQNCEINMDKIINNVYGCIKMFSLQSKLWKESNAQPYLEQYNPDIIDEEYENTCAKAYKGPIEYVTPINKEDAVRRATQLVSLLSEERASDYDPWMRVGWALHNIEYSLLSVWIDFSRKSPKFKEGDCDEKWRHMKNEGLTIRSLMLWAEQDNYIKYQQFIKSEFSCVLNKSLDGSTYYIAKALHTKYIERFICSSLDNDMWYEFYNHRWNKIKKGYTLFNEISTTFANEYIKLVAQLSIKLTETTEPEERETLIKKTTHVQKIVSQLNNLSFKEKVMKECKNIFYDPEFENKLDEKHDLIGFNNGVYDLTNCEFRIGRPDDYISKTTNTDYSTYNPKNLYAVKMNKFFSEILPNEDVRKYFLMSLSTCVSGYNKESKLYIATGNGSNGKSLLFSLVQLALGEYYVTCNISMITRKRGNSSQASPELAILKGARCGCFQETDDGEKINVGMMKEITGNDTIYARPLYCEPIEFKPQIKFYLACNQLPAVPSTDGGTWRRLRVIGFNSKFVESPEKQNEFLIDNSLKEKMENWGPIFGSYLIHLYVNEYKKLTGPIPTPDAVKYSTDSYKMENDHFTEFFNVRIVITNCKDDIISIKTMYDKFKEWFKFSHEGCPVPAQNELNKFLDEKIGKPKNQKWRGYKVIPLDENGLADSDSDDLNDNDSNALDKL